MLNNNIINFLAYSKDHGLTKKSIETLSYRIKEFDKYLDSRKIKSLQTLSYEIICEYVTSNDASSHVKKLRVWTMQQFFRYLKTIDAIKENPAQKLPYPHIEHKEPKFLTPIQLCTVINYFLSGLEQPSGFRSLILLLFLAFTGIRISTLLTLNIQDIDLTNSCATVTEKGGQIRIIPLPQILCTFLYTYLKSLDIELGPLLVTTRHKRLCLREVQRLWKKAGDDIGLHLNCHLFRHTAATYINQVAGIDIAKNVLGHSLRQTTEGYIHLNPDIYAEYMARHPFMSLPDKEV